MAEACARSASQLIDAVLRFLCDFRGEGRDGLIYSRARVIAALDDALAEISIESRMLKRKLEIVTGPGGLLVLPDTGSALLRAELPNGRVLAPGNRFDMDLIGGEPMALLPENGPGRFRLEPPIEGMRLSLVVAGRPAPIAGGVEASVPVWLHLKLKYGAAVRLLPRYGGTKLEAAKLALAANKWKDAVGNAAFYWSGDASGGVVPL